MKINQIVSVFFTLDGKQGLLTADGWLIPDGTLITMLNSKYTMPTFNARYETNIRQRNNLYALAQWAKADLEGRFEITDHEIIEAEIPDGAIQ